MLLKTKEFREVCSLILSATDSSELSTLTETLELKTEGKVLYLNTTNKEYYSSVTFDLEQEEEFHATVNANLFLKLIAALTTETIELSITEQYVIVKANGVYKIPLMFEDDHLMDVPVIVIDNKTVEMNISGEILNSILTFNSKQLTLGTIKKPVQKMYYLDQEGCITFTSGATVNNFTLEKPIKILLNNRLVKLFRLFKNDMVKFTLGYDQISETIIQTKVSFETPKITLTAILATGDDLLSTVPVTALRGRANNTYPYNVVLSKVALTEAINRLLLFSAGYGSKENIKPYSTFEFTTDKVTAYDSKKENFEKLVYQNGCQIEGSYSFMVDLIDFKTVLDGCNEDYVTLCFGDSKAVVLKRANIINVIPEVHEKKAE